MQKGRYFDYVYLENVYNIVFLVYSHFSVTRICSKKRAQSLFYGSCSSPTDVAVFKT